MSFSSILPQHLLRQSKDLTAAEYRRRAVIHCEIPNAAQQAPGNYCGWMRTLTFSLFSLPFVIETAQYQLVQDLPASCPATLKCAQEKDNVYDESSMADLSEF